MQGIYLAATLAAMVFSATLVLAEPKATPGVRDGIAAWQRNENAKAVETWRPLAQGGDADAAFNLGQAYRLGRGVARDLGLSQKWYEQAARKGHINAQTALGLQLLQQGEGVTAVRWLKSAAENGEPRAMLAYGTALFNGQGTVQDRALARNYVSRAAATGLDQAKSALISIDQMRLQGVIPEENGAHTTGQAAAVVQRSRPKMRAEQSSLQPDSPAPGADSWRIQLGAFAQRATAERLFEHLAAGGEPLAQKRMHLQSAGSVVRLQVGPFPSRAAAASACAKLSAKGQPCFPVRAD